MKDSMGKYHQGLTNHTIIVQGRASPMAKDRATVGKPEQAMQFLWPFSMQRGMALLVKGSLIH